MMTMQPTGISRQARKLPLIILADTSSSMAGTKIATLNQALQNEVQELRNDPVTRDTVLLSLITFGGIVSEVCSIEPVATVSIPTLNASGGTPMGQAFRVVLSHLSDRSRLPVSCAIPTLVLCSDGQPTDEWRTPLDELKRHPLASMAVRLALAIGPDADKNTLAQFVDNTEHPVLQADEVNKIGTFFQWVTLHTKSRSVGSRSIPQPADLLP